MARHFSGRQLRAARIQANVSPELLALGIGRSAWTVFANEADRAKPPADVLGALADLLGTSVDTFFAEEADAA